MTLQFYQFDYNDDNYGVLVHDPDTGCTAAIDAGDATAYLKASERAGWTIDHIWITHHHWDHVDGLGKLKAMTQAKVYGPEGIKGIDIVLSGGDSFEFCGVNVNVLHTPGHTLDMLNYHMPDEQVVFTGDTLFSLGCGRLFEGTPAQMWESLSKLAQLPRETVVYSSHEYTLANANFALSVDPDNPALKTRVEDVKQKRNSSQPTVPSLMSDELATNPFLRAGDTAIRSQLGMPDAPDAEVFAEIRRLKDNF